MCSLLAEAITDDSDYYHGPDEAPSYLLAEGLIPPVGGTMVVAKRTLKIRFYSGGEALRFVECMPGDRISFFRVNTEKIAAGLRRK